MDNQNKITQREYEQELRKLQQLEDENKHLLYQMADARDELFYDSRKEKRFLEERENDFVRDSRFSALMEECERLFRRKEQAMETFFSEAETACRKNLAEYDVRKEKLKKELE